MKIYLNCPYEKRGIAKLYGARWDADRKQWFFSGDQLPDQLKQFAVVNNDWGKSGVRYDENCDVCDSDGDVDNKTGCCRRCHGNTPAPVFVCAEPYRRGIGQGFGSTEDGDY